MVTLDQIREEIKSRLSIDKELHFVNVHADTIEEVRKRIGFFFCCVICVSFPLAMLRR